MIGSAAPIAVASNVARIVLTAVIYQFATFWPSLIDLDTAAEVIHQWAGYMMMPIGLLLLLAEMSLLNKLMIARPSMRWPRHGHFWETGQRSEFCKSGNGVSVRESGRPGGDTLRSGNKGHITYGTR